MRKTVLCALVACFMVLASAPARSADEAGKCYGLRAGYGLDPDQFVVGAQADMGSIYRNVHFAPSFDAGFGDHLTTLTFNGDINIFLHLPKSLASLYGIVGPAICVWTPEEGDGDTEIGVNLGVGARMALGGSGWYNIEARFGAGDIPEMRFLFGVLFGGR